MRRVVLHVLLNDSNHLPVGQSFAHTSSEVRKHFWNRVYLSALTVNITPASTVTTNGRLTNTPLVVRSPDGALLAAIELHDLPAPDDENTPRIPGAGCPLPAQATNVSYGPLPQDVICPPYNSATSKTNRSDA